MKHTAPSVIFCSKLTAHTAAGTPFCAAALSSGRFSPCTGSRRRIHGKCSCFQLPTCGQVCFSGVRHDRAAPLDPHCNLGRSEAGRLSHTCGTACNAPPNPCGAGLRLPPPSSRRTVFRLATCGAHNHNTGSWNGREAPHISSPVQWLCPLSGAAKDSRQ